MCQREVRNQEDYYEQAVALYRNSISEDKIAEAKKRFLALGDYKDSAQYVKKCEMHEAYAVGKKVSFGSWKGKEIVWTVLDEQGHNRMLFADECLENQPFNIERDHTNWAKSTLRHWMNKDFLEEAFTLKERMTILLTNRVNLTADPRWSVENGPDTRDKAFVFTKREVMEYLPTAEERANGSWWWLRNHGAGLLSPMAVYEDGTIYELGVNKNSQAVGVRPVIWVRLPI